MPWHVQSFVAIHLSDFGWEQKEFLIKLELQPDVLSKMGSWSVISQRDILKKIFWYLSTHHVFCELQVQNPYLSLSHSFQNLVIPEGAVRGINRSHIVILLGSEIEQPVNSLTRNDSNANTFSCFRITSRPKENGCHFADSILKCISSKETFCSLTEISLKGVPKDPINNISALLFFYNGTKQATSHYLN